MTTKKHLRAMGFVFTSKRSGYKQLPGCKAVIIGGVLSFTVKPLLGRRDIFFLQGMKLETLKTILRTHSIDDSKHTPAFKSHLTHWLSGMHNITSIQSYTTTPF